MAKANAGKLTVLVLNPVGPKHNKKNIYNSYGAPLLVLPVPKS